MSGVKGSSRDSVHPDRRFCGQCGARKGYSSNRNRSVGKEQHASLRCYDCDREPGPLRFEGSTGARFSMGGLPACGAWDQEHRESVSGGSLGLGDQRHVRLPDFA